LAAAVVEIRLVAARSHTEAVAVAAVQQAAVAQAAVHLKAAAQGAAVVALDTLAEAVAAPAAAV